MYSSIVGQLSRQGMFVRFNNSTNTTYIDRALKSQHTAYDSFTISQYHYVLKKYFQFTGITEKLSDGLLVKIFVLFQNTIPQKNENKPLAYRHFKAILRGLYSGGLYSQGILCQCSSIKTVKIIVFYSYYRQKGCFFTPKSLLFCFKTYLKPS